MQSNEKTLKQMEVLDRPGGFLAEVVKDMEAHKPSRDEKFQGRFSDRYTLPGSGDYAKIDVQFAPGYLDARPYAKPETQITATVPTADGKSITIDVAQRIWAIDKGEKTGVCFMITPNGDIIRANAIKPRHNDYGTREWKLEGHALIKAGGYLVDKNLKPLAGNATPNQIKADHHRELGELSKLFEGLQVKSR